MTPFAKFPLWFALVAWASIATGVGGTLTATVHHTIAKTPLLLGETIFTNAAGNVVSVSRLDYLLSEFVLITDSGRRVMLTNQFAYVSAGAALNTITLTNVPPEQFKALQFRIGVGPELNHADPARFAPHHPLNPILNGLHWNWQGGYVFLAIEGTWRQPNSEPGGYSYHLATDALEMRATIPVRFTMDADTRLALSFDVARVFSGTNRIRIDESTTSTHSRAGDPLAIQLAGNVTNAFSASVAPAVSTPEKLPAPIARIEIAPNATPYRLTFSKLFPIPALPRDNPITDQGVALGRRLFNDTALSINGQQSCATCHRPAAAFTDSGKRFSSGSEGVVGKRNAMPLANLAWNSSFFWDGRTASLREQVLQPVINPDEMHESLPNIVGKLDRAGYTPAFVAAFGTGIISADRVARALEQFLLTLVSHDSKFDHVLLGLETFTRDEQRGFELFQTEYDPRREQFGADCFHCHGGPLFSDLAFHNNGLDAAGAAKDLGRFLVTSNRADLAKFKTPSLRNVALTAPYMHDGRFATLEEAVAHYAGGVKRTATLDPNLSKHPDGGVQLSADDQRALVAFLKTLSDPGHAARGAARTAGE